MDKKLYYQKYNHLIKIFIDVFLFLLLLVHKYNYIFQSSNHPVRYLSINPLNNHNYMAIHGFLVLYRFYQDQNQNLKIFNLGVFYTIDIS